MLENTWKVMETGVAMKCIEDNNGLLTIYVPALFKDKDSKTNADYLFTSTRSMFENGILSELPRGMYLRNGVAYAYNTPCNVRWIDEENRYLVSVQESVSEMSDTSFNRLLSNPFTSETVFETLDKDEMYRYSKLHKGYDFARDVITICTRGDVNGVVYEDGSWRANINGEYEEIKDFEMFTCVHQGERKLVCRVR